VVKASVVRYAKASIRDLTARLFALPRELRDIVYGYIWEANSSPTWSLIKSLFIAHDGKRIRRLPACTGTPETLPSCKCLAKAPSFLDPGLIEKHIISELLELYHQEVIKCRKGNRSSYRIHWDDMEAFASRDVLHLGATLHGVLQQ
jgi:hypothetical protein